MPTSQVVRAPRPAASSAPISATNGPEKPPATVQELLERRKYHRLPHNPLHDSAEVWQREAPSAGAPLLEAWRFAGDVWEVRVMFDAQVPLSLAPKKRGNYGKEETATAWASTVIYAIPAADLMKLLPRLEEMLAAGMRAMRGVR